jgi:hypothetical protein
MCGSARPPTKAEGPIVGLSGFLARAGAAGREDSTLASLLVLKKIRWQAACCKGTIVPRTARQQPPASSSSRSASHLTKLCRSI